MDLSLSLIDSQSSFGGKIVNSPAGSSLAEKKYLIFMLLGRTSISKYPDVNLLDILKDFKFALVGTNASNVSLSGIGLYRSMSSIRFRNTEISTACIKYLDLGKPPSYSRHQNKYQDVFFCPNILVSYLSPSPTKKRVANSLDEYFGWSWDLVTRTDASILLWQ
jgi:hypothetical protein